MSIEILSLIDHHHHTVMPKSFDVAELARYTLALGKIYTLFKIHTGFRIYMSKRRYTLIE